jgi:Tol biopolymer transport system component
MKHRLLLAVLLLATASTAPERFTPFAIPAGSFLQDPAFTPDGTSLFLTRIDPNGDHTIVVSTLHGGTWSTPAVAPFSGQWRDLATVFSADGNEIIFASNRPAKDGGQPIDAFFGGKLRPKRGGNLWSVRREGDSWGTPVRLPDAVNSSTTVFSPALAADGTLYFMHPSGPKNSFHLFIAKPEAGVYRSSEPAPFSNGPENSDFDPTVAPDNSFVIFISNRPPSRPGTADIFITFRHGDTWTTPEDMDRSIDPNGDAIEPRLSPDMKTLYYTAGDPSTLMRVDISPWVSHNDASQADPKMFAPGTISDGNVVSTPVFSSDGTTLYFSTSINNRATIVESHLVSGTWTKPSTVSFSGQWDDMDPALASDGSYLIFSSKRPVPGDSSVAANLWRVDRTAEGWGVPVHLPATVNVGEYIFAPSIAGDGTVYFLRSSKTRAHQLFRARYVNGGYQEAQPLTFSNPSTSDYDPEPSPDQSYVVFASSGRAGAADKKLRLYVALAHANNWDVHPLPCAGDTGNDSSPVLSRNGTDLYFTSDRGTGTSNVWVIPFRLSG